MNGQNAEKRGHRGNQWWGKRLMSGLEVRDKGMKFWKRLLHKKERTEAKKIINDAEAH